MPKVLSQVALAYIFDINGRVLIAKRPQGKHMAGFWEFPGGMLEPGESPAQAIEREILEELAIEVVGGVELTSFVLPKSNDLEFFPIVCQWISGDIVLLEHDEYSFVALGNLANNSLVNHSLANHRLAPADVMAAQRLMNFLRNTSVN